MLPRIHRLSVFPVIACLAGFPAAVVAQHAYVYSGARNGAPTILYVPSIDAGDHSFGNVWFDLADDNSLVINRFTRLDDREQDALSFLENTPCSPNGNLEKVAAYLAYQKQEATYCLRAKRGVTIEGGTFFTYLFVRNQSVQYVEDVRGDGYAKCCFGFLDMPGTMTLGTYENGEFVAVDITDVLDLTRDYVLRVPDADGYIFEF